MDANNSVGASWSREDDKVFEKALVKFPDGVDDRWMMIAGFLPDKSPDEFRAHYEDLLFDVAEIESGRVELPCYSDETASLDWDDRPISRISAQISFGSPRGNRSRHSEVERKKGTPWTEDEHKFQPIQVNARHFDLSRIMKNYLELFCLCSLITIQSILIVSSSSHGSIINEKVLHVGEGLFKETMSLQNGSCLYQLRGLRPHTWYEVKISYPASIPVSFSLQLSRGISDLGLSHGRKLLNIEKLIFKTDGMPLIEQGRMSVQVNVEPEGVVALAVKHEREYVMFNIVCDELLLGIPHQACYVAVLVLICLVFAFAAPSFLPPFLLSRNGNQPLYDGTVTKDS